MLGTDMFVLEEWDNIFIVAGDHNILSTVEL
jgi:hypothetical protein